LQGKFSLGGAAFMSKVVLVTGALGEVGHGLINYFQSQDISSKIVALDLNKPAQNQFPKNVEFVQMDISDAKSVEALFARNDFQLIFHLAGVLSTGAEKNPELSHRVNVEGSFNLIRLSRLQSEKRGIPTRFLFPSTIAVYGLPSSEAKRQAGKVKEEQFLAPIGFYGMQKLYVEDMGRYFSQNYKLLADTPTNHLLDFRALRYPGLLSTDTLPSGGTSDYGSEILHAAAKGQAYNCFVDRETRLPFMAMPDAIQALIKLSEAPLASLTQRVYNVGSFSISAEEILAQARKYFPASDVNYAIDKARYRIVESWPADLDDTLARRDWGWAPRYDKDATFRDYMIPGISRRYNSATQKAAGF